jgi:hypothetical protein
MIENLTVEADQSYAGSVISWRGDVDIRGGFKGSIILVGGRLRLDGQVEEDVISLGADIEIGQAAVVKGDLLVIGGTLDRSPASTVNGEFFYLKFDLKKIETTLMPVLSEPQAFEFLMAVKIIMWLIIALIVFAVVPGRIVGAGEIFAAYPLKIGITGILSLITLIFLLFMFIIMSFFIIGIPLLFILVIFYFIIYLFGRTVMFYFIGLKLASLFKMNRTAPALFIVFGALAYAVLKFIPILGPFALIILNIFEVGIGVGFIFRKKLKLEV